MFSSQIRGFLYGVLITTSFVSVFTYASVPDGVFGDYFENIVTDASTCGTDYVITGFYDTPANFGKQKCTTFQNIVKSIISPHLPVEGKAVTGFMNDGTPIYGDVNWHKDASENLSYTGAGNVGIGTNSPGATLSIAGSNDNGIRIDKISGSSYNYMEWLIGGVRSYWNGLDNNGKYTIQSDTNDVILLAPTGGNVGIGTATPSTKLEVNGEISSSSRVNTPELCLNGNCRTTWPNTSNNDRYTSAFQAIPDGTYSCELMYTTISQGFVRVDITDTTARVYKAAGWGCDS